MVAIGPGISRHPQTSEMVRRLVAKLQVAMVVDADGLNAFEGRTEELNGKGRTLVITPHPGEMARLAGSSVADVQKDRLGVARKFAREHELIVVLKGHRTLVVRPDGEAWVNTTGNPGMSTGGTGDILTGMVAGMIAQHPKDAFTAVMAAVHLHGLAGDVMRESVGEHSLVATDLLRGLAGGFPAHAECRKRKDGVLGRVDCTKRRYLEAGKRMVFPEAAERRAASRISVTVTFVSSDDNPSGFIPSTITALRSDSELSYGGGSALAAICSSCAAGAAHANVIALYGDHISCLSVDLHVFAVEGPVPRGLHDGLRFGIGQDDSGFVVDMRINFWFDLLRDGSHGFRALAVHQPGHEIGAVAAEVEESASAIQFGIGEPAQKFRTDADFFGTAVTVVNDDFADVTERVFV